MRRCNPAVGIGSHERICDAMVGGLIASLLHILIVSRGWRVAGGIPRDVARIISCENFKGFATNRCFPIWNDEIQSLRIKVAPSKPSNNHPHAAMKCELNNNRRENPP